MDGRIWKDNFVADKLTSLQSVAGDHLLVRWGLSLSASFVLISFLLQIDNGK